MNYWLFIIPVISAFLGWFINSAAIYLLFQPRDPKNWLGFHFQGIFPKRRKQFAENLGKMAGTELFSISEITRKVTDPGNLDLIIPYIDAHIETFLKVKLKESMPVISMFIGDKTINQLKELFLEELKSLFPAVMEKYMSSLEEKLNLEQMVTDKILSIPEEKIASLIRQNLSKEIKYFQALGAVSGFIIGGIALVATVLSN